MMYSWSKQAKCNGSDTNIFFGFTDKEIKYAKSICAECPVRAICLETALKSRHDFGIWGGTTEGERETIRRKQRRDSRRKLA